MAGESKPDVEGFQEDAPNLPTPSAVNLTGNVYQGVGNPDIQKELEVQWGPTDNDFPRQTGSDSLTEDEAVI